MGMIDELKVAPDAIATSKCLNRCRKFTEASDRTRNRWAAIARKRFPGLDFNNASDEAVVNFAIQQAELIKEVKALVRRHSLNGKYTEAVEGRLAAIRAKNASKKAKNGQKQATA